MIQSLFYPLGYIASFLFFLRFYIQWFKSEKKKKSHVTKGFWNLSLSGNICMGLHALFQLQLPILLIQTANGIISWRNKNLMQENREKKSFKKILLFMACALIAMSTLFFFLSSFFGGIFWMGFSNTDYPISFFWHLFGLLGMLLFASRFWVQWFQSEKMQKSVLQSSFWILSLTGGSISLTYFLYLHDPIQTLSYGLGLLPFIRNLMLLKTETNRKNKGLEKETFFFIAGEKSGDLLGANLIDSLKKKNPHLTFKGIGGPSMQAQGLESTIAFEKLNVMGIVDVLCAAPRIFFAMNKIKRKIIVERPESVILIDYPDFNMLLAKKLRGSGYRGKIIHYVSPTVWAWRKNRIHVLSKTHDLLLSILPFEKQYYAETNLPVCYVGHPLIDEIAVQEIAAPQKAVPEIVEKKKKILSLFPGSRLHEVKRNLPIQLETAILWLKNNGDFNIVISCASKHLEKAIYQELQKKSLHCEIAPSSERYSLMQKSSLAIATSGTVTLELALYLVPTLVTYVLSPLNYFIGRYLFKIDLPFYCIVNILAQKEIYPEFVGKKLKCSVLNLFLENLIVNEEECKRALQSIRHKLQEKESTPHDAILNCLTQNLSF
jgi:lipid-A-disaccharide synthase